MTAERGIAGPGVRRRWQENRAPTLHGPSQDPRGIGPAVKLSPVFPQPRRGGRRPIHSAREESFRGAAAGVPAMFVQLKAGHAQGSTTERYLYAAKTSYPDAAGLAEARLFAVE